MRAAVQGMAALFFYLLLFRVKSLKLSVNFFQHNNKVVTLSVSGVSKFLFLFKEKVAFGGIETRYITSLLSAAE